MADDNQSQSGSLTDLNTTQQQGVRNLGLILPSLAECSGVLKLCRRPGNGCVTGDAGAGCL